MLGPLARGRLTSVDIPGVPAGLTARRPTSNDAGGIFALVDATDQALLGHSDSTEAEIKEILATARSPLDVDHWLVEDGGRVVGWGCVLDTHGTARFDVEAYVHPALPDGDRAAVRAALLGAVFGRLRELAAAQPDREVLATTGCVVGDDEYADALVGYGFTADRRFSRMRIEVDGPRPLPNPPPGVAIEAFNPATDWVDWHRLLEESFADHWGHEPTDLPVFREWIDAMPEPEIERWRFVLVDGRRVGVCQTGGRYADEGGGWVHNLGVLADARGRGAGRYVLEHVIAEYAAHGRRWVGLGVDTENVTGALRLYESVGMRPVFQIDAYRRRVEAEG